MSSCPSCSAEVADGDRFCASCGHPMSGGRTCTECGGELAPGAKFCSQCGARAEGEVPEGPGYVVDGEWHRAAGELVRRIAPEQMRSAFARLLPGVDLDGFFRGTLVGKLLDKLQAKTIRVPAGSVGVVMLDGVCKRVLPPGEQTTIGWLKELVELTDRVWNGDRLAFYLVDLRPVPVSFTRELTSGDSVTTVRCQALVALGSDRDRLGTFVNHVVRDADTLSAQDLHIRFRADVEQAVTDALASAHGDLRRAQVEAARALMARLGARTGLSFEVSLAPRHTLHRLDVRLGDVPAPDLEPCPSCGADVGLGQGFCMSCGAPQTPREADVAALFTSDAVQVELDLVLTVSGDQAPDVPLDQLRAAAHRHLRDVTWDDVVTGDGFAALETALAQAATQVLGSRYVSLDLLDLRSKGGEWTLNARADMERARAEVLVGREWIDVQGDRLDLEELTLAVVMRQQQVQRDHAFSLRQAEVEDAKRLAELEAAERELARQRRDADHDDALTSGSQAHERRADVARKEQGLRSELLRQQAADEAEVERLRREARLAELGGLAEIDAKLADQEHRQRIEKVQAMTGRSEAEILALQATELADKQHGGAFADALGKLADGEAARRERERADARIDAKDDRVMGLMEKVVGVAADKEAAARDAYRDAATGTKEMAQTAVESHAKVAAAHVATAPCPSCSRELPAGAKFCGGCGTRL